MSRTVAGEAEVGESFRCAEGIMGMAGLRVADPVARDILVQASRHEISTDEAIALALEHYDIALA